MKKPSPKLKFVQCLKKALCFFLIFLLSIPMWSEKVSAEEALPYENINPSNASTYNVSIETVDGQLYFSITAYDLKRVSNIFYRTEGFTLSRGALNTQTLRNGAATEYIAMPVYRDESDSYDVRLANNRVYQKNIWRYPLSDVISTVRNNGYEDWAQELETFYYHNGTDKVYLRFDGIMVTVVRSADGTENQSGIVNIANGKLRSLGTVYTNLPADNGTKINALKHAYGWRDNSKIEYHYNRWIPADGTPGDGTETDDFTTTEPTSLYETKNYAENFDISMGIPSGEEVTNVISAAALTGNNLDIRTKTVQTAGNAYNVSYTVRMTYTDQQWVEETKEVIGSYNSRTEEVTQSTSGGRVTYYAVNRRTGNRRRIGSRSVNEREVRIGNTFYKVTRERHLEDVTRTTDPVYLTGSLKAALSYQYLGSAPQIYEYESMDVYNGHFPENEEGKRLLRYNDDSVYYPSLQVNMHVYNTRAATLGLHYTEINQHMVSADPATYDYTPAGSNYHYYIPAPAEINRNREITITGEDANDWSGLIAAVQQETNAIAAEISEKSWSRNDYILINDGARVYNIMSDTKVTGADVEGSFQISANGTTGLISVDTNAATAATSGGKYDTSLSFTNINTQLLSARVKGLKTVTVPGDADNVDYPTGVSVTYRNIFTGATAFTWTAGKNFFVGADSIYNHVMEGGILSKHDGGDPADGYPIRVHTPIVSPFTIVDSEGNNAKEHTQLVAEKYNQNAKNQLLLDSSYYIKWDNELWLSSLWGETPQGYDDIMDKYVTAKYMRFPFTVIYDGTIYPANDEGKTEWIEIQEPYDYQDDWSDGADASKYESNNHWQMTPFTIPSFAQEGGVPGEDIYVEVKVAARNTQGRDLGDHSSCVQIEQNSDKSNYVATSFRQVQLSGWIYDFSIVGTENGMVYNGKNFGVYPNPNIAGYDPYPLCPEYKEVRANNRNRLGNPVYRHLMDGTLSYELPSVLSKLPIKDGSSPTFKQMGAVWRGQDFAFTVKTIADLDDPNDSIEIVPSFTYITASGEVLSSRNNDFLLVKVFHEGGFDRTCFYDPSNTGMDLEESLVSSTYLENPLFDESYYTPEDSNYFQFGNWVQTSLENEHEDLNTTQFDEQAYRYRQTDCYTLSHITIPSTLRLLSGEYEQMAMNQYNQYIRGGTNTLLTYKDLGNAGDRVYKVNGVDGRTLDEAVKYSMQQWHGGYVVSNRVKIIDMREIGTTIDDFYAYMDETPLFYWNRDEHVYEDEGTLIINFDIYAYKDGEPYLRYSGGNVDAVNMWEREGYEESTDPTLPIKYGDVVIVDMKRNVQDYYEPGILFIN